MNWMDWVIVSTLILNSLANIALIGKPRQPLDPGVVMWVVIINVALILGLVLTHG